MTDIADLGARLEELLRLADEWDAEPLDSDQGRAYVALHDHGEDFAAVALRLARALRLGGEHDGPCDNLDAPYHKEVPCTLHEAMEAKRKQDALAGWERMLKELGDG